MKGPWSLIGWLLAGLLALLVSLGLYCLGPALGWEPWLAPAVLWAPLLLALIFQLTARIISRPKVSPASASDPANPFTGQWEALKSGLGPGSWELYLAVGDDDEAKRSFLSRALGQTEYQAAPAGPDGLSLRAADGRAWLNVPAALWRDRKAEAPAAALGGDWAHLLKLLPSFPGRFSGLAVLADPRKIMESPARQGQRLAGKLSGLAGLPGAAPSWWLVLYPMDRLAAGQRLEQALREEPEAGAEIWRRPFGLFFPEENSGRTLSQKMAEAQSCLAGRLGRTLTQIDRWPGVPAWSGEIFAIAEEIRKLPLDSFTAEVDAHQKADKLKGDGLFLAFEAPQSPGQFTELLLGRLIPARSSRGGGSKARRVVWLGAALIFLTALTILGIGYGQGRRALDLAAEAFPVLARLERHPAAPPPVDSLAAAADLTLGIKRRASGPAGLYPAPREAAEQARSRLAGQLNRHLPREYGQPDPFIIALAEWADHRSAPLAFKYPGGRINVPGFAAKAGREKAAELAFKWDAVLDKPGQPESSRILSHYDAAVFEQWRQQARNAASGLDATPEKIKLAGASGLSGQFMGLEFLKAAGAELSFTTWREIPGWITAARELDMIGGLGDPADGSRELASVLRRIKRGGAPLGPDGVERVIGAARAWKRYEAAAYGLADLAESPQGLRLLAEEMFSGAPSPAERASLAALRKLSGESLSALLKLAPIASEPDRVLFEKLFLSPVDWLTEASVAAAAAALEEEWSRKIALPSKDLTEPEKAALLLGEDGALAAFRDGPARPYLVSGPKGYQPKEVLGRKFPWNDRFIKFINAGQEGWKKAAGSDGRLKLSARLRPVRAEGDRLAGHPLGVDLDLACEEGRFQAKTFNQPADFNADWSPKTCDPLKVTITFRDFKLTKTYEGVAGLTAFVRAAVKGELRYAPDDFPDQSHLLKVVGADFVVVSLDLNKGREILKALTAPAPVLKPPASITGN